MDKEERCNKRIDIDQIKYRQARGYAQCEECRDGDIDTLINELDRLYSHKDRQLAGYVNKIKNQRYQLKQYERCAINLREKRKQCKIKDRLINTLKAKESLMHTQFENLKDKINSLYDVIKHGKPDHKEWLKNQIALHFAPADDTRVAPPSKPFKTGGSVKDTNPAEDVKKFADVLGVRW